MYTPCLPLTSSDEYVHAVGQYMKPCASTPKSGGRGRRERDLCCHSFTTNGNRKRIQCNQIFHRKYDLLLPRLRIPLAKQHVFLIRRHIVIERVRKKLSNMLPGVVSKSIRDYFLADIWSLLFCGLQLWSGKPSRLYPSRCGLGWELFIFDNQCVEYLTKYK